MEAEDKTAVCEIYAWISSFILPGDEFISNPEDEQGMISVCVCKYGRPDGCPGSTTSSEAIVQARTCSAAAIRVLDLLNSVLPVSRHTNPQALIVSLAAFTDERAPWVAAEACHTATGLLQAYLNDTRQGKGDLPSIVGAILKHNVRPLFAKSKNPAITSQGRKNIRTVQAGYDSTVVDPETKSWKYRHPYIVSVFRWVLQHLDVRVSLEVQKLEKLMSCR